MWNIQAWEGFSPSNSQVAPEGKGDLNNNNKNVTKKSVKREFL